MRCNDCPALTLVVRLVQALLLFAQDIPPLLSATVAVHGDTMQ